MKKKKTAVAKRKAVSKTSPAVSTKATAARKPAALEPRRTREEQAEHLAGLRSVLHDDSEPDEDGFIKGGGFDRYGGFEGDGLS